jgi:hypothetical protein
VAGPQEGVAAAEGAAGTAKPPAGAAGKLWLKVKPVNVMDALLVMVNVKVPLAVFVLTTIGLGL